MGAAATSVAVIAVRYLRTREINTLGALVLLRFGLDIAIALVYGDARLQLAKDYVLTGLFGVAAAVSLLFARPLIARIRRDLEPDPHAFDRLWREHSGFRAAHRLLTMMWTAGLVGQAGLGVAATYTLPLTAVVVVSNVLPPTVLIGLITVTEYRGRRAHHAATADLARPRRGERESGAPPVGARRGNAGV